MGIQKGEIFKNRYYTRNLRKNFFKKKYLNFFKKRKEQLYNLLKKLNISLKKLTN